MKKYLILPGGSFRTPEGVLMGAGEEIELASDVAATHKHLVREKDAEPKPEPAPSADDPLTTRSLGPA